MTATYTTNLALQGGGAHGAFTWGVLDRLLEEKDLSFEAISATSAGSMNAVALAAGMAVGGHQGARDKLHEFWTEVSRSGERYSPIRLMPWELLFEDRKTASPNATYVTFMTMAQILSPYRFSIGDFNPLKNVLTKVIDFDLLRRSKGRVPKLALNATNVRTGKVKVFTCDDISADAVLATACLPTLFKAVEIDGEAYWDGGFMGNPALFPLIYDSTSPDILIVHINPLERHEIPKTSEDIHNRVNEITFNSSLMRELRAVAFISELIDSGQLQGDHQRVHLHSIHHDEMMQQLGVATKLSPDWVFLTNLRDEGRRVADAWLRNHKEKIGKTSSVDIAERFL